MFLGKSRAIGCLIVNINKAKNTVTTCLAGTKVSAALVTENGGLSTLERGNVALDVSGGRCAGTMGTFSVGNFRGTIGSNTTLSPSIVFIYMGKCDVASAVPFVGDMSGPRAIMVPVLGVCNANERVRGRLPSLAIASKYVCISSDLISPKGVRVCNSVFHVICKLPSRGGSSSQLVGVRDSLGLTGVAPIFSSGIRGSALRGFSCISPVTKYNLCFKTGTTRVRGPKTRHRLFSTLVSRVRALTTTVKVGCRGDLMGVGLSVLSTLSPSTSASVRHSVTTNGRSRVSNLVCRIMHLTSGCKLSLPTCHGVSRGFQLSNLGW